MTIGRICQREVYLAEASECIVDAARRMREKGVGTLVVLDLERRPAGIVTDRDITLRAVADNLRLSDTTVEQVMTAYPRTVSEDTSIEDSLSLMRTLGVRRLPVVDCDGRLAGIVSLDDVLSLIVEELRSVHGLLKKEMPSGMIA